MKVKNTILQKTHGLSSKSRKEIASLVETEEFIEFAHLIEDSIDDGLTFNELLSSKEILQKALEILKQDQD